MEILLIGGPKHGEKIPMPTTPLKFNITKEKTDVLVDNKQEATYVICVTGDGTYYGVFEPINDPSVLRAEALRNAIMEAMDD